MTSLASMLPDAAIASTAIASTAIASPAMAATTMAATAFRDLSPDQQAEIWSSAKVRRLLSGETLVFQNTKADAIFVVVSGRFEVRVERQSVALAEIGVGQPIGEIAFFAGGLRTATVGA